MARYPLFGLEQSGRSRHQTSQRMINLYAEPRAPGDRSTLAYYPTPGLELFVDLGETPIRGLLTLGTLLYVVHRGTLYSINNAGTKTELGTLSTTSGRVSMATNGTEVMLVDGTAGYIHETSPTSFAAIADGDFPTANTVAFQGGRFIVDSNGTGQFHHSASYDGTAWDALDFATAEGFPDDLVRVLVDHGQLLLFGTDSLEVWADVGAADFPYQRIEGAAVEWGLAARWSVARVQDSLAFLGQNRMGSVQAMMLGARPVRISGEDEESAWNAYATVSDASGLSYMVAGHPFYQLNFPTERASWLFDGLTGAWSILQYGTAGARHRGEIGVRFIDDVIVSDYENGKLYRLSETSYADNGVPPARELIGRHIFDEEPISLSRLWLDIETGVGAPTGQGRHPQAMLSISKDGGYTYGPERWVSIGKEGEYKARALWRRLGRAYEWTFKIRMADPVKTVISGAWVDAA